MSEQTNADVVRQVYEAFGSGDIPAMLGMLTDDVEFTMQGPPVLPYAGTHRGREGIAEFASLLGETLEFERFGPREFVAQGDTVVVLGDDRSLVKSTGRAFEEEWAHVYTLRDGKIAKGLLIEDTAAQVVAFGAAQEGGGASSDAAGGKTARTEMGPEAAAAQPTGD
jgi:uncharacterized protein